MCKYGCADVVGVLRRNGVVVTPHRYRMLSYFLDVQGCSCDVNDEFSEDGDDWYSASRIYSSLLEEGYFISLSAVYKNLCLFRSMGLIDPDGRDL